MAITNISIVVVGDEILKAQVADTNSRFICSRIYALGARVSRIAVVADDVSAIGEEVRRCSETSDWVLTCGGIGPTHDDVTYEGVARAFDRTVVRNNDMAKAMKRLTGCRQPGKMAMIPQGGILLDQSRFPVVQVENVLMLPGIPQYCEMAVTDLEQMLVATCVQFYNHHVRIKADEITILAQLNQTVQRYLNRVTLGSYPFSTTDGIWHTRITLESKDLEDLCNARADLLSDLSSDMVDKELTAEDAKLVLQMSKGKTPFAKSLAYAIKVIEEALGKYSTNDIVLSFNGGKDCTVLMHLVWAVICLRDVTKVISIKTLYVVCENPFPEMAEFITMCKNRYNLDLIETRGPIKTALEQLSVKFPNVKAVWMGTRRTDPYSKDLTSFKMCDAGWPEVMRISPLLDWSYQDVWTFLRCLAVPYCSLYDVGYTSLGNKTNTKPNPALLDSATNTYKPAYMLKDDQLERNGRL